MDLKSKLQQKLVRWGIIAAILLIVFLIGLIPMWLQKRAVDSNLAAVQKDLRKSEISYLLTSAIVEANRGEYEPARQNASDFFTRLRTEVEKGEESAYTKEEREKLSTIFTSRDAVITMLAQRDQASTERLNDIYAGFRQAVPLKLSTAAPTPAMAVSPQTPQ